MSRRITPQTTLDNLKKEAKRWLKELRANDAAARTRFERAYTTAKAPENPGLRDVQRALALEHGYSGWSELKRLLEPPPARAMREEAARFLEYACPDHHVRGRPAHRIASHAAMRLLDQHPDITGDSIFTAVVCGELEEVERILRQNPQASSQKSSVAALDREAAGSFEDIFKDVGSKGWEPLLYLCFTRLPLDKANDNAVAIARTLLDHGANPNAYFMAGDSRYTPLVGVIGEGEENRPPHPQRDALARLLLEHGAEPYDIQVVYNIHFHGEVLWFMELIYEFSVKTGRKADWDDPEWRMLDMGGYGSGARWHLGMAVQHNDVELAQWCLNHGANPNASPARDTRFTQRTLYEEAARLNHTQIAELLARYGAKRSAAALQGEDAFVAACFRRDRQAAEALIRRHPEFLHSPAAMHSAAERDRNDIVEFLLQLGMSPDIEDPNRGNQHPLHVAAYAGSTQVVELLIRSGAQIDPVDSFHDGTPLWFAMWAQQTAVIDLLRTRSRDIWALSFIGDVERIREVLQSRPELATMSGQSTPLFWLPEDENKALEIIDLFLAHGADATFRRADDGLTAADVARKRGLNGAARRLDYEQLAQDMVTAYASGDGEAMQRINKHYGGSFSVDDLRAIVWRMVYKVRQAKGAAHAFGKAEAQDLIARSAGFGNWSTLAESVAKGSPPPVPPYAVDTKQNKIWPRRVPDHKDWDALIHVIKEQRITAIEANGLMTDEILKRLTQLDHVTSLSLGGSRQLSDDGLRYLARMPQLEHLNLSEYPGGRLTDRGLEVLRHLPNLKTFEMTWQSGISDAGAANLKFCEKLESVDLMGSPTGDGAIEALRNKPHLHRLHTGRLVTDAGLAVLQDFPLFKKWHGDGAHLLIDGPFTNNGLAKLMGMEGIFDLDLFWHVTGITADAFAALRDLPNLGSLGCDGKLSSDEAMRHIATIPRLRKLRAQGTVATDEGFIALSHSTSLEHFWGRECPNLTGRGFVALSKLPALRFLGVSCKNVDDASLSALPLFPALRDLTPIDVKDEGFRHVGRCIQLERLSCMYCRDTTDVATEHIAGLQIKTYYAGLTQITDRSLEILGRMSSLESIEFYEVKNLTDAGLVYLAKLPRLREVHLSSLPKVTFAGTQVFPAHVRVEFNV